MTKQEARLEIRGRFAEYLDPAKKKGQFICPLCGHGKGGDGLSLVPVAKGGDGARLHCFGCGFHGDLLDLYAQEHGLGPEKALEQLCSFFSLQVGEALNGPDLQKRPSEGQESSYGGCEGTLTSAVTSVPSRGAEGQLRVLEGPDGAADFSRFFLQAVEGLSHPDAVAYLQGRGISLETARKCGVGFVPAWVSPTALKNLEAQGKDWAPSPSPRVILPTSGGGYSARAIREDGSPRFRKMKEGPAGLFNPEALWNKEGRPVFLVEGEFDALSVLEAGGLAVALGSVSNQGKLTALLQGRRPSGTLILALDNDKAGQDASVSLSAALEGLFVPFIVSDISLGYKDPNEALTAQREAFAKNLWDTEQGAGRRPDSVDFYLSRLMKGELQRFRAGALLRSGFDCLDDEAGGIYPGLYVLGAISSLGKTTFIHQMADQMAGMGVHVLYFSLEQSRLELVTKSLARIAAQRAGRGLFSSLDVRTGRLAQEALPALRDAFMAYRGMVGYRLSIIEGNFGFTVGSIKEYVSRYMDQNRVKPVVVVDYLQILAPAPGLRQSAKEVADCNITELKRLSRDKDIPVFVVSSVNRANYLAPIDFESFKESGGIEYTADVVWGLQLEVLHDEIFGKEARLTDKREKIRQAKAAEPRRVELVCLKNRYGVSSYHVGFEYFSRWDWFREVPAAETGRPAVPVRRI